MAIESMGTRDEETPPVVDILESETPKNRTRDVHILSCAFLLVFLAYGPAQNLVTTVNAEGAFAQLKVWQSSAIAVVFFLSPAVTLQTMVVIMLAAIFVSLVPFLYLILKVEKAFS